MPASEPEPAERVLARVQVLAVGEPAPESELVSAEWVPVRAQVLAVEEPASEQVLALGAWAAVQVQASAVVQPAVALEPEWPELEVQLLELALAASAKERTTLA